MKTEVTTTVKISIKGVELDLTADEARELAKSITDALKPPAPKIEVGEDALTAFRKIYEKSDEARPRPPHPYHPPFHYQPTPAWGPMKITCTVHAR